MQCICSLWCVVVGVKLSERSLLAGGGVSTYHRAHSYLGLAWIWPVHPGIGIQPPLTAPCLQTHLASCQEKRLTFIIMRVLNVVQVAPKSCGHVQGKRVVGRQEAVARLRAAVDAREEGADILIVARTDSRQAQSLEVPFLVLLHPDG